MSHVLIPIPSRDFDPTEVAVSWSVLVRFGHQVSFATPDANPGQADDLMLTGQGLDLWSSIPGLRRVRLIGGILRANGDARAAYARLIRDRAFKTPLTWTACDVQNFDALLLPGGHRARGMREYLESQVLQQLVISFFAADKPVAAICHGVLLAARSLAPDTGRSVLFGRKTTALTWRFERAASRLAHMGRPWGPNDYRTYLEKRGEPVGYMSVEQEVTRALESPDDFLDVEQDHPNDRRKVSGRERDTVTDPGPAFVVCDGHYVSARWPGDAHTFAKIFSGVLAKAPPGAVTPAEAV